MDEFGVAEPIIQQQGNNRIIIELAGITDPSRVRQLIGKTAKLEFLPLIEYSQIFDFAWIEHSFFSLLPLIIRVAERSTVLHLRNLF